MSSPTWNLDDFSSHFTDERKDLTFMARTAEAAERYEDMCRFMRALVSWADKNNVPLTVEERNLLSVAYKNVIGARRASWRTLSAGHFHSNEGLITYYKELVERELEVISMDVLDLLERVLAPNKEEEQEARVFYLKMTGDYYRYLAEFVQNKGYDTKAGDYYKKAMEIADAHLTETHPIRLGLALNYSVCYYEILKDPYKACEMAKKAFDQAISKLDKLDEASYKDSTLIMQLLRDNLTLWTSDNTPELEVDGEETKPEL